MKTIQTLAGWLGIALIATALAALTPEVHADAITDWNVKTGEIITEARIGTPPAIRVMALVQTAAHNAVVAVAPQSAIDAAVAAAHRAMLLKLLPAQQAAIDAAYQAALVPIAEGAPPGAPASAAQSRPTSRASGTIRCPPSTTAWCARSRCSPGATCCAMRACSR